MFQELYLLAQDILIDKLLTLWKGCLSFKLCLPLKVSTFGIKIYELCDATTRHLWSFIVQEDKDTKLISSLITADTNKTIVNVRVCIATGPDGMDEQFLTRPV
jgi:hypothetical protein